MACQPVGRGGARHFTAGNIRFVSEAKKLVEDEGERQDFAMGLPSPQDQWVNYLEDYFGIEKCDRGDLEREQLVVGDQDMHRCIGEGCDSLI